MARYIDADNLVERLKVSPIFQDFGTDGYFIRDMVIDLVGCRPTADVVPKSEVDKTIAEWAHLHADVLNKLENAKVEVSRVIFEEIEKTFIDSAALPDCARFVDINKIAELKKKYTEEKE